MRIALNPVLNKSERIEALNLDDQDKRERLEETQRDDC